MKNKEKFANEIIEIATGGSSIAMDNDTKTLCPCRDTLCCNCYFSKENYPSKVGKCDMNRKHWANSEYKEPKEFTKEEKALIRVLDKVKWVVREKNGVVCGYTVKPVKCAHFWDTNNPFCMIPLNYVSSCEFKAIKWEDTEPTSREEILGGEK